jgi:hypothetical protein
MARRRQKAPAHQREGDVRADEIQADGLGSYIARVRPPAVYCRSSSLAVGGEAQNGDNLLAVHDAESGNLPTEASE